MAGSAMTVPADFEACYAVYYAETEIFQMNKPSSMFKLSKTDAKRQLSVINSVLKEHGDQLSYVSREWGPDHVLLEFRKKT